MPVAVYVIFRCEKTDSTAVDLCGVRYSESDAEVEIVTQNAENGAFIYYYEETWLM